MNQNVFTMKSFIRKTITAIGLGLPALVLAVLMLVATHAVANDLFGLTPKPNTQMCSSTPPKCIEKSPEDLRYERILEALKKMEGGKEEYSKMATPANEPASYGKSQMTIDLILNGLKDKGGASHTFTAESGTKYTITKKDLEDAIKRGRVSAISGPKTKGNVMGYAENNYSDYKTITIPARDKTVNDLFTTSGIASGEWDTWWERAVAYAKLQKLGNELRNEYRLDKTVVKDDKGKALTKYTGTTIVMATFQKFVEDKGNISGTSPAVSYSAQFTALLDLVFPHETNKLNAIKPYLWKGVERWQEGRWSFYNRAAYSHPTIPYADFRVGIARWYEATPAVEETQIRETIKAAAKNRGKTETTLHPDKDEEEIARYTASKHNTGDFGAIKGDYANKLVEHWKTIKWNFKCGTDPRTEPSPKVTQG